MGITFRMAAMYALMATMPLTLIMTVCPTNAISVRASTTWLTWMVMASLMDVILVLKTSMMTATGMGHVIQWTCVQTLTIKPTWMETVCLMVAIHVRTMLLMTRMVTASVIRMSNARGMTIIRTQMVMERRMPAIPVPMT